MPRGKNPLPDDFEEDLESGKIRCILCRSTDPLGYGKWIGRAAIKAHLSSQTHQAHVVNREQRRQQEEQALRRLNTTYTGPTTDFDSGFSMEDHAPHPGMFAAGDADMGNESLSNQVLPTGIDVSQHDEAAAQERLQALMEQLYQQNQYDNEFGDEEDIFEGTDIAETFRSLGIDPDNEPEIDEPGVSEVSSRYFPYSNKTVMLLDVLDNLPRLRLSSAHLRLILWLLKQVGARNVPSYTSFRKTQSEIRKSFGVATERQCSSIGNVFYKNSIAKSIAMDLSNPQVAPHLHFYPEEIEDGGAISEFWQAGRMRELDASQLTPMYSQGMRKFYIEEVCRLRNGQLVIPHLWIVRKGELHADVSLVDVTVAGKWSISRTHASIKASEFALTYLDLQNEHKTTGIPWDGSAADNIPEMPNPMRKLVKPHQDLYVAMVPAWCDDVSGNRSKQYNKHLNVYMVNAALPGQLLQREYFVRFVSTSPHAGAAEQFSAIRDEIKASETNPIVCYNAHSKQECGVILRTPGLPADNPMQSELSSHMIGKANFNCRKCKVGGRYEDTESDAGYAAFYRSGTLRSAKETRETLQRHLDMATQGLGSAIKADQTATGTKDKVTQYWIEKLLKKYSELTAERPGMSENEKSDCLRNWLESEPGDKMNPLLDITGLDPTQDTPVEILHTILLGIIKYVWYMLHKSMSEENLKIFAIRLQSTNIDGLFIPPIRATYIIDYRNNLIGKHFKMLMQTMAFHVHGLVNNDMFELVKAVGSLGAMLWIHQIENMDHYLKDLEILIHNVLDAFGVVDPVKILVKVKMHLLPHLLEDIRRFGPAVRFSTEVFECFNAVFRLCSIYSNRQAPSRDIAHKFESMDRLKHILSGGYWLSDGEWVTAGSEVQNVLQLEPIIQRHLGWVPPVERTPGDVRLKPKAQNPASVWCSFFAAKHVPEPNISPEDVFWQLGASVVSRSLDVCKPGYWVFAQDNNDTEAQHIFGRIHEILVSDCVDDGYALIEQFDVGASVHPDFGLPLLQRKTSNSYRLVATKTIQFPFSVQHDCRLAGCAPEELDVLRQEREKTSIAVKLIHHKDDDHFVINLFGLHNAALLRSALPRTLIAPKPLKEDRPGFLLQLASRVRDLRGTKRKANSEKRKQSNKAKKEAMAAKLREVERLERQAEASNNHDNTEQIEEEIAQLLASPDEVGPDSNDAEIDSDADAELEGFESEGSDDDDDEYVEPRRAQANTSRPMVTRRQPPRKRKRR